MTDFANAKFELAAQKIDPGSKLLRAWELKGGWSAQVTGLEIEQPGGAIRKVVVRRHGPADLKRNPQIAENEFKLLQTLQAAGLPTPAPYYIDLKGEICDTPCVIVEYMEGEIEYTPSDLSSYLTQMADHLLAIHRVTPKQADLTFLPRQEDLYAEKFRERPDRLDESLQEGRIRAALAEVWPLPGGNPSVLLHGDYWPGNILWEGGRLVGIIDWESARLGDPLEDLANSRLEVLWQSGVEAMETFTHRYISAASLDFTNLPYWELCAALRPAFKISEWASGEASERGLREGHRLFVAQAFEKLGL